MKLLSTLAKLMGFALVITIAGAAVGDVKKSTPHEAGYSDEGLERIKKLVDPLYEDGLIPNYVVALYKDGKSFFSLSRGTTFVNGDDPVDLDTIYHMASMSKPFVSTAILRLIEEGKLSLNTKLSDVFPEFKSMFVVQGGDFDSEFEVPKREITILNLLTHTSGFTYSENIIGYGDVAKQYDELGVFSTPMSSKEHLKILAQIPLVAHPGEEFNYSVSIDVLGAVIEEIEGKRLGQYLRELIFDPLGMRNTGYYVPPEKTTRLAGFYGAANQSIPAIGRLTTNGIDWKIGELPQRDRSKPPVRDSAGGGILSTANDYARYLTMVANGGVYEGHSVLGPEFAAMHSENLIPDLPLGALEQAFGDAAQYMSFGGGFGIKREEEDPSKTDYLFWAGAFNTFFWVDVEDRCIGLFLTHHWPVQYNISDQLEQIVDEARL